LRHGPAAASRCELTRFIGTKLFDDSLAVNINSHEHLSKTLGCEISTPSHSRSDRLLAGYAKLPNSLFDSEDFLKQFNVSIAGVKLSHEISGGNASIEPHVTPLNLGSLHGLIARFSRSFMVAGIVRKSSTTRRIDSP